MFVGDAVFRWIGNIVVVSNDKTDDPYPDKSVSTRRKGKGAVRDRLTIVPNDQISVGVTKGMSRMISGLRQTGALLRAPSFA